MSDSPGQSFQTTHWTEVLAARGDSPEAREALRRLCSAYYAPVVTYIDRALRGRDDARDLAHAFFARLLEGDRLAQADRTRGRFRSYLLGAVKHFLADATDARTALRRGGGASPVSLEARPADGRGRSDHPGETVDPAGFPDDAFFDHAWALAVLQRSLDRLQSEAVHEGKAEQIERLRPWLTGDTAVPPPHVVASELGLAEGSLKVIVHRLRKRFRELVREELATTVDSPADVEAELDYLIRALAR